MTSERETTAMTVRMAVDASFAQDAARARLGYTEHTATALRRRAVAAGNGKPPQGEATLAREGKAV